MGRAVSASVEAFARLSEEEPDLKNVLPLVQAHEKLGKAFKTCLEARGGAVKAHGKRQLSWVSMISSLQEAETEGTNLQ